LLLHLDISNNLWTEEQIQEIANALPKNTSCHLHLKMPGWYMDSLGFLLPEPELTSGDVKAPSIQRINSIRMMKENTNFKNIGDF
jgi:hypothetical protein